MYHASFDDQFVEPTLRALNILFIRYGYCDMFRRITRTIAIAVIILTL